MPAIDHMGSDVATEPNALKVLLRQRHLQEHRAFCREYDRVAREIDHDLVGTCPSKATFYRWLSSGLRRLPHPGHCRVLEKMLPGWTAETLFAPWAGDNAPPAIHLAPAVSLSPAGPEADPGMLAGVTAIYPSRTEFANDLSPHKLFDTATHLDAAGLSLNLLCQQYPDRKLRSLLRRATVRLLFLDPDGDAIKRRNREEGHEDGHLSAWTHSNLHVMRRQLDDLDADVAERVQVRLYDETIRFNLMFIDHQLGVMQTYLPALRGLESPTFVMEPTSGGEYDLYSVYYRVFMALWEQGAPF